MAALTKDRDTIKRTGQTEVHPVASSVEIFAGALVVLDAGYAKPGAEDTGLIALGRANEHVDNSAGSDGDELIEIERGIFRYDNDGDITQAEVGTAAYIVDDQTVAAGDGDSSRSEAGIIRGIETGGVWVEI